MDARPAVKRGLLVNGWAPRQGSPQNKKKTRQETNGFSPPSSLTECCIMKRQRLQPLGVMLSGRVLAGRFTENAVFERHSATDFEGKV
jgi:hypothetical protein